MRRFLRHCSDLPIELLPRKQAFIPRQRLHNISLGGIACHSPRALRRGTAVELRIPLLGEQARYPGLVAWCRKEADGYQVGIAFTDHDTLLRASLVEQICQIEQHHQLLEQQAGQPLRLEDTVQAWLQHHAATAELQSSP